MTDGNATTLQRGRRRIIERPRLTRLLDESPARIKMLVAPAGYGKTTLARQWLTQERRKGAWLQCTPAASDVAVLLAQIADASTGCSGGDQSRMLERLRVTAEPTQELAVLIDLIVGDLQTWPGHAWLVLDDYHALMRSGEAEQILRELISRTRLNVLITSRRRPTWATPRQIFYGEVVELGASVLAMDDAEAKEVLGRHQHRRSRELVAAAEGWPAFIALAALNDDITVPPSDFPSGSYEFLANEIYFSVDEGVQSALREIALAPRNHTSLLRRLHPHGTAIHVQDEAVRVGIFSEAGDGQIELHPLLQQFLLKRSLNASTDAVDHAVARVWTVLTQDRLWDDAFAVLAAARRPQLLPELFDRALDPLLEMGRTMSLRGWIDFAVANDIDAPVVKLAEAELALRAGTLARAEAIATEAAGEFEAASDRKARSWCIAGQAAHLQSQEEVAISYFREATKVAETAEVRQVARWGELASSVDLELDNAERVMHEVVANETDDPAGLVRRANAQLIYELRFGELGSLREAAMATQVIDRVKDPIRRAGFWSVYATALAVTAHYDAALEAATGLLDDVRQYRIDFALPYAHAARGMAMLGLRRYEEATEALVEATVAATHTNDEHALANADAIRARLMLTQGRYEDAAACLEGAASEGMTRGMAGELLACQAVALACLSDSGYSNLAIAALKKTRTIETRVLVPVSHAIFKSLANAPDAPSATRSALDTASRSGSWDCFICGYRAHPESLLPLRGDKARLSVLGRVVQRVGDEEVLAPIGIEFGGHPRRLLSPRESEIHSLVAMGLTNREIATRLVISEATVKLHVHRVLEKLGVKTRTAAAAQYRAQQAQNRG